LKVQHGGVTSFWMLMLLCLEAQTTLNFGGTQMLNEKLLRTVLHKLSSVIESPHQVQEVFGLLGNIVSKVLGH